MKSTQLLTVVFSLIMFTGVTAGNTAFAESDDLDVILEDYCELTLDERVIIIEKYELDEYAEKLAIICEMEDDVQREESLWSVMDAIDPEMRDEMEDDFDDVIEDFEDCVEAGYPVMESYPEQCTIDGTVFVNDEDDDDDDLDKVLVCHKNQKTLSIDENALSAHLGHGDYEGHCEGDTRVAYDDDFDLDDLLDRYCGLNDDKKRQLLADHPRLAPFNDRLANYCDLSEDEQDAIDELIEEHGDTIRMQLREYKDDIHDKYSDKGPGNLRDHFAMYCDMTAEERAEKMEAKHDEMPDDLRADMARYCEMSEDEQDSFRDTMMDKMDDMHDKMSDHMDHKKDMRMMLDKYCEMTDADKKAFVAEHDKAEDHVEKMNRFCALTGEYSRMDFIMEHKGEYMEHMKDKMHGTMTDHMDYDRLCVMAETDRALEITDVAKLDRISKWCDMSTEEREDYKEEHHDEIKEKVHDKMEKFSEKSDRLKAMIMDKRDISDERHDEIKMKFESKFGEDSDKKRSEIKMKYKDHMLKMKFKMSDERKSDVHDRLAEMKAYKAELREKSSEISEQEKQQLREEFIEKAKSMQLAWISPRTQMTAGIDSAEVECREGFSLVMKASNGAAMCLHADSALKMIDRGIVVPAI